MKNSKVWVFEENCMIFVFYIKVNFSELKL